MNIFIKFFILFGNHCRSCHCWPPLQLSFSLFLLCWIVMITVFSHNIAYGYYVLYSENFLISSTKFPQFGPVMSETPFQVIYLYQAPQVSVEAGGEGRVLVPCRLGKVYMFPVGSGNFCIGYKQRDGDISTGRGHTFGDFVSIRTEGSMQDVTVARLQSTRQGFGSSWI